MSDMPDNHKDQKEICFLNNEYEKTWNHLHFIHTDRTKYITVFVSLLAGSGYLFLEALNSRKWAISISIAIFSGFFNIFFLKWFMNHRVSALYFRDRLTQIRKLLFEYSVTQDSVIPQNIIENSILPIKEDPPEYSREYEFYNIIVLLILLNFGAGTYLFVSHYLCSGCSKDFFIIVLPIIAGIILLLCSKCLFNQKFINKNRR